MKKIQIKSINTSINYILGEEIIIKLYANKWMILYCLNKRSTFLTSKRFLSLTNVEDELCSSISTSASPILYSPN